MNCEIIQDLLPLYADDCCSKASRALVEAHLKTCPDCRALREAFGSAPEPAALPAPPRLRLWEASFLQVALYFLTFALMAYGVLREGHTPAGSANGRWAFALIIPASAFLLSLTNLYFIRIYRSRKRFVLGSFAATLGLSILTFLWGCFHYGVCFPFPSLLLTAAFCILSPLMSSLYGRMVGKE